MEDNLIHTVINEVLPEHKIKSFWKEQLNKEYDGTIKLEYKGNTQAFYVEIKKEIREYQLPKLFQLKEKYNPLMVIAEKIFPKIKNALVEKGIAYVDMYGNIHIEAENILIKIEGKGEKYIQQKRQGRAFTKAGLKALLLFLMNEININDTYRDIAKKADIGRGNVQYILEGLIEEGFGQ